MNKKKCSAVYGISTFLLIWLTVLLLLSNVLFIFHISISYYNLIVSFILTFILLGIIKQNYRNVSFWGGAALLLLVIFAFICGLSIDFTWDGSSYHKLAVGMLKDGWNPIYQGAEYFNRVVRGYTTYHESIIKYVEGYPKASWYIGANIYYYSHNIECGKAYTLLFMMIVCGTVFQYAKEKNLSSGQAWIIGLCACFNPIALAQVFSYYVDGMAICVLIALFFSLLLLKQDIENPIYWINVCGNLIFGCNLKFSITFFTALMCVVFFVYVLLYKRKNAISSFIKLAAATLFAFLGVGFTCYITNFIRHGNMFYGFIGEGSITEGGSDWATPFGMEGYNNVQMFLASFFGRMGNRSYSTMQDLLKIPFTFKLCELEWYNVADARTGGLGVLYSGIFLISFLIVVIFGIQCIRKKENIVLESALMLANLIVIVFLPGGFQLRYVGHIYIFTIMAMLVIMLQNKSGKHILITFFVVLLMANSVMWGKYNINLIRCGQGTYKDLRTLKQEAQDKDVMISFVNEEFVGLEFNLLDQGINELYNYDENVQTGEWHNTHMGWINYAIITE